MPLLEIAWFETVVAAQRDKNLPPEAGERRVAARSHTDVMPSVRQPHAAESAAKEPLPR